MSQNDDELNMQTFQIYQDDPKPAEKEEVVEPKGKGKSKAKAEKTSSGGSSELLKGLLIGVVIVAAVIVLDMFIL